MTLALVAPFALAAAVTAAPAEFSEDPAISSMRSPHMEVCDSGGPGTSSCDINCHVVFNFYTSQCGVSCRTGYFACCSCDTGCKCAMDHDEMWPLPAPVEPRPPKGPLP